MTEREVVNLIKEWKDEIKGVVDDYNKGLSQLDTAVALVNKSKERWWVTYKTPITIIATLLTFILSIYLLAVIMRSNNLCIVTVGQKENSISVRSCEDKK